jgi:predicted ATPase
MHVGPLKEIRISSRSIKVLRVSQEVCRMELRPRVLELRLLNYKSVAGAVLDLEPLTILIGPNGAGKSNILDALSLLSDAMSVQLRSALESRGGVEAVRRRVPGARRPPRFGVAIKVAIPTGDDGCETQIQYGFEARAVPHHGYAIHRERFVASENAPRPFTASGNAPRPVGFDRMPTSTEVSEPYYIPRVEEHALLLPVLSGYPRFSMLTEPLSSLRTYSIDPRAIRDLQDPMPGTDLAPDGRNIASIIQQMQQTRPDDHKRLCELLNAVVPGTESVSAVRYGPKLGLRFTQRPGGGQKPLTLDAASMSDGTLRALGILAAVFQEPRPLLIGIEEPEATLHPGALGTLMDVLKIGEHRSQVLITTHSPDVLDAPDLNPDALRLVRWQNGATRVSPLGQVSKDILQQRMATTVGELLRSNYLRPAEEDEPQDVDLFPDIPGVSST